MSFAQLLGRCSADMTTNITAAASPPSLAPLRSLLARLLPRTCVAPLSPRAEPHVFFARRTCMADMSVVGLRKANGDRILGVLLRRAPYPPPTDPASQRRTWIVSSSHNPCSTAGCISSSLALGPYFGFGFGPVIRPCLRTRPFFAPGLIWLTGDGEDTDRMSLFGAHGSYE
jgi:hypothetical protein